MIRDKIVEVFAAGNADQARRRFDKEVHCRAGRAGGRAGTDARRGVGRTGNALSFWCLVAGEGGRVVAHACLGSHAPRAQISKTFVAVGGKITMPVL